MGRGTTPWQRGTVTGSADSCVAGGRQRGIGRRFPTVSPSSATVPRFVRTCPARWDAAGRPLRIVHPSEALWDAFADVAPVQIRDGGYTEVPAGTRTAVAWWSEPL